MGRWQISPPLPAPRSPQRGLSYSSPRSPHPTWGLCSTPGPVASTPHRAPALRQPQVPAPHTGPLSYSSAVPPHPGPGRSPRVLSPPRLPGLTSPRSTPETGRCLPHLAPPPAPYWPDSPRPPLLIGLIRLVPFALGAHQSGRKPQLPASRPPPANPEARPLAPASL